VSTVLSLYHGDQIGCQGEIASDTPVWTHERENRRRPSCSSVVPPQTNSGLMCCASFPRMHRRVRRTELARQLGGRSGGVRIAAAARPTRVGPRARVVLPPRGFWLLPRSEVERAEGGGRETCRPEGSLRKKRRDRRSLRSLPRDPNYKKLGGSRPVRARGNISLCDTIGGLLYYPVIAPCMPGWVYRLDSASRPQWRQPSIGTGPRSRESRELARPARRRALVDEFRGGL
jgi:hypothetical protein